MGLFSWFSGGQKGGGDAPQSVEEMPWDQHPSIYEHIEAHVVPGETGLSEGGDTLPDEKRLTGELKWVAGGMDGAFSHHVSGGDDAKKAGDLFQSVQAYCSQPTAKNKKALYDKIVEQHAIDFIDPLLEKITNERTLNTDRLYECARSFATQAPDREAVKLGIAILGLFRLPEDRDLFLLLGRHEEFTLYCSVALMNAQDNSDLDLWELAKNVDGWGRINTVERLAQTENPQINDWLLREGYKNSVMYEYLAYTCAESGNLKEALDRQQVDDGLLDSAAEIITALIAGGPAQDMDDYEDGAAVTASFLGLMDSRAKTLTQLLAVSSIKDFLANDQADWKAREGRGWAEDKRTELSTLCKSIMERPTWRTLISERLKSDDALVFFEANQSARVLGIDTWPTHWERLQTKPLDSSRWYEVMRLADNERIGEIIAFAEKSIPVAEIATGPADEMGFGKKFVAHSCMDYILQDLRRFPGKGFRLVEAGLRSPVVRNRNMSINALSEWGKDKWPETAEATLKQAISIEPKEDVRKRMLNVLDGKPPDDEK